jgi:hypothetical protein
MEIPPCIHHQKMSNKGFCVNNISSTPICCPHDRPDGINLDIAEHRHLGVYRWPYKLNKFISKRKFMVDHKERIFDAWYIYWVSWNVYLPSYIWRNSPRDISFSSMIAIYTLSNCHYCALWTMYRGYPDCAIFKISGRLDIDIWSYGPLTGHDW